MEVAGIEPAQVPIALVAMSPLDRIGARAAALVVVIGQQTGDAA
jgi:hypothetical protein